MSNIAQATMRQQVASALKSFLDNIPAAETAVKAVTLSAESTEEKPLEDGPLFTYLPVIKSAGRLRIDSNELRRFLIHDTDLEILSGAVIEEDGDAAELKKKRLELTVRDIREWFPHLGTLKTFDRDDINCGSGDISYDEFQTFVAEIEKHYLKHMAGAEKAFADGVVSFADLVTYLVVQKGNFIIRENDALVSGQMVRAAQKMSMMGPYLEIVMSVYFNSADGLVKNNVNFYMMGYDETKTLEELGLWSLTKGSKEYSELVQRGDRYLKLTAGPAYVQVTGPQAYRTHWATRKYDATGRYMVDFSGMKRAESNYSKFYAFEDSSGGYGRVKAPPTKIDPSNISDDIKAMCSPFLYGFSLKSKQWGEINIEQVSDIKFRADAYDKLVLDPQIKELIFAQVEDRNPTKNADIIDGKGGGTIFLLEGRPGIGKTASAETVAERLQRPLYTVSVGELGTTVDSLESNLRAILETATEWNAILLIDEADIFLEARTDLDIERNAMVAVFLRLLEYYQGILFLTTNRAANLDEAFFSRISLAIHYPDLTYESRKQVWTNLLASAKIPSISLDVNKLSHHDLNGRQIKSTIKTAGAIARFKGRNVAHEDFELIIDKQNEFQDHVKALQNGNVIDAEFKVVEDQPTNRIAGGTGGSTFSEAKPSFWSKVKALF